jgi:hypothetical protein
VCREFASPVNVLELTPIISTRLIRKQIRSPHNISHHPVALAEHWSVAPARTMPAKHSLISGLLCEDLLAELTCGVMTVQEATEKLRALSRAVSR